MKHTLSLLLALPVLLSLAAPASAQVKIALERPGDREFIRDLAGIITPEDQKKIRDIADSLLTKNATPIIVVTIDSMADYGGAGMTIETFSTLLFNQWGIGHKELGGQDWNTGILLLVSRTDRRARIELGAHWGREKNELARQIMEYQIIPHFRTGDFSGGILAGVEALDHMARGLELPKRARPWWHWALGIAFIGLFIFTIVSLIRRGASGWAWLFWGGLFALGGYLLYNVLNQRDSSSGGGFSGGSFGGGFSGGGGATGSW